MDVLASVRQCAADAILLRQQRSGTGFFMTTTPLERLGGDRAARAAAVVGLVREGETFADIDAVARRILPTLVRLAAEQARGSGQKSI